MKKFDHLEYIGIIELNKEEQNKINGGFLILGTLAAIAGIVYILGEMAYMKGRQDSNCD